MTLLDGAADVLAPSTLAALVRTLSDAVVLCDHEGRIRWVNEAVEELLGWSPEDLVGRSVEVLVPAGTKGRHVDWRQAFLHDPVARPMAPSARLSAMRMDGELIPVDISLSPIETEHGPWVAAAVRDATDRRAIERELAASKDQFATTLDTMLDGCATFAPVRENGEIVDFTWTYINEIGARTYGRTAKELIGVRMTEVVPFVRESGVLAGYVQVVETGRSWSPNPYDWDGRGAEGTFEFRSWKLGDGLAITWRDVADSVRAQRALEASEKRLREVLGGMQDALQLVEAVRDEAGRVVDFTWLYANRNAAVTTGYAIGELVGQRMLEMFPGLRESGLFTAYCLVLETGEDFHDPALWYEDTWGNGQRARRCFDLRATRAGDGVSIISRDVTAEREREAELGRRQAELERSNAEMRVLNELGELLQACTTPAEAYEVTSQVAVRFFPERSGAIWLLSPSRDDLEAVSTWGQAPHTGRHTPADCWAMRRGQPHLSASGHPSCRHVGPDEVVLCVPMLAQGETSGTFELSLTGLDEEAQQARTRLAVAAAGQVSLVVANLSLRERLQQLSIRDPLTDLYNRRFMEESLSKALHECDREGTTLSVAQLDMDHFKRINDTYGHDAGDAVLRTLAEQMRSAFRGSDVVCRYGGEEFTVLLPATDADAATERLEELRDRLRNLVISFRGTSVRLPTVSAGLAEYPVDATSADDLLHLADEALYAAKRAGRDRLLRAGRTDPGGG